MASLIAFRHLYLLANTRCLSLLAFQIIKLRPANLTAFDEFDFVNCWRYYREDSFNAYAIGNFPDSEGLAVGSGSPALNYSALKLLDPFLVSFFDFHVNVDRIAGLKTRHIFTDFSKFLLYKFN